MRTLERSRELEAGVVALAERQHGVVARRQLLDLGMGRDAIGHRIRCGRLHRIHAGVYAVGHRVLTTRGRWMAAVLFTGPGAVLSHRSAAALWGIRGNHRGPIDTTAPGKARSHGPVRRHHSRFSADEVKVEDGIPVTTVPRTILDLAAAFPAAVEPALRQAEFLQLHDPLSLQDLLERHPGQRGSRAVRAALDRLHETPGRTRSTFEDRFLLLLDRYELRRPQLNVWLAVGAERFQVDCLWPDQRLIVELDGWNAHATRTAVRTDKARDRKLAAAGYATVRVPWRALDDEPAAVAADLRRLLRARG